MTARRALVATLAMLLVGCQSISPGWRDSVSASVDESLSQARAGKDGKGVPSDVSSALLPAIEITLPQGGTVPLEPRFDLTVNNAPARQVFMGLVEGTPYSMIMHPDVSGSISLNLKEATVPEALSAIRQVYGYEYRREGNRFFILGSDMQTRIFNVNYLNFVRKGKSDTRASGSGEIGRMSSSSGGGATNMATAGGASETGSASSIETTSQTDFWKEITEALKGIVGSDGGRKVIVNAQTGIVLVRAMPDELRMVDEYLGITSSNINRQVVLEAKILEVELNDRFQAGINWSAVKNNYTASQVGGGTENLSTTGATPVEGTLGSLRPGTGTFIPELGTLSEAFGGVFTLAATGRDFTAFLELLKAQGEVQVLSSPRVSTVNNQKAIIKVGGDEFFVTSVKAGTTSTSTVTGTSPEVGLTSFFSGIVLDVTPQIDERNNIILHIRPSVGTVSEKTKSVVIADEIFSLPTAFSTIQESDNVVRAQSGQFVVIGGLMKEGSTEENAAVPLLGDIPILGNLFKHKKVTRIKKELVILLKPTIINTGQDWSDAVGESQDRIRKIRIGS
jgi:MSHA biogenesis protein MshL